MLGVTAEFHSSPETTRRVFLVLFREILIGTCRVGELGRYIVMIPLASGSRASRIITGLPRCLIIRLRRWLTWIPISYNYRASIRTFYVGREESNLHNLGGHDSRSLSPGRENSWYLWRVLGHCTEPYPTSWQMSSDPFHGKLHGEWCVVPAFSKD